MKDKDILKIIKRDITESTPDVLSRIDLSTIEMKRPSKEVVVKQKRLIRWDLLTRLGTAAVSFAVILTITLVVILGQSPVIVPAGGKVFQSKNEVYAFSASSAGLIANDVFSSETRKLSRTSKAIPDEPTIIPYIDALNPYLRMSENIIDNKNKTTTVVQKNTNVLYPQYTEEMVYTSVDILGKQTSYTLYYNEEIDEDDDEIEREMIGVMLIDDRVYPFKAEEEKEDLGTAEEEISFAIKVYLKEDDSKDYVKVKQSKEQEDYKFSYEIKKNGNTVSQSQINLKYQGNKIDIEIELETSVTEAEYELTKNEASNKFSVEYQIKGKDTKYEGVFTIEISPDQKEYLYQFEGLSVIRRPRN